MCCLPWRQRRGWNRGRGGGRPGHAGHGQTDPLRGQLLAACDDPVRLYPTAMPLNAPQSLSLSDVYAVSGYVLFLNGLLPEDATVDGKTLTSLRMPNRDGFIPDPVRMSRPPPA